jgi:hypothetical protein
MILSSPGSGPAIQSNIEMLSFFLDGRVKHGHDEERFLPRVRFFHTLLRGNDTAESRRRTRPLTQ